MLKNGDYVFHIINGIGRVEALEENKAKVRYKLKTIYNDCDSLSLITEDTIDNLLTRKYEMFFDPNTRKRGLNYYESGLVKNPVLMEKSASAKVLGTDEYIVNINFSKNTIRAKCSCPVGVSCKHSFALLECLYNSLLEVRTTEIPLATGEISNECIELVRNLDDWNRRNDPLLVESIAFAEYLKGKDSSFYDALIKYLNTSYKNKQYGMNVLKRIIIYNEEYYTTFLNANRLTISSSFGCEIKRLRENSLSFVRQGENINYMRKYPDEVSFPYYVTNRQYKKLFDLILAYNFSSSINLYIPILLNYLPLSNELIDKYISCVNKNYGDFPSATKAILSYMSDEEQRKLYQECKFLSITINYIKKLNFDKQLDILLSQRLTNELAEYALEKYYTFREFNEKGAVNLVFRVGFLLSKYKNQAVALLKENKNAILVEDRLKRVTRLIDYTNDSYYAYYDYCYEITEKNNMIMVDYSIVLGGIDLGVCYKEGNSEYLLSDNEYATEREKEIAKRIEALDSFKEKYDLVLRQVNKKNEDAKKRKFESAILDFENTILKKEIVFATTNKMRLELSIAGPTYGYTSGYTLSLRTGNDKLYVVKDIVEFLDACKEGIVLKYGKGLEFNHQLDNFDESAKKIISYLLSLPYASFSRVSRKDLMLSNTVFANLLQVAKGTSIVYFENDVYIRLEPVVPELNVDSAYSLSSSIDDMELLDLGELYIVDKKQGYMDKISATNKELDLYKFFYDNAGMDISVVKQLFIDSIYSRFSNKITVSDAIADDFYMSKLTIVVYFDIQDGMITKDTKYYKDEEEVIPEALTSMMDKARVNSFNTYLDSLGFIEDKIIDEISFYNFLNMDFDRLKEMATVYLSDSIRSISISKMESPTLRIQYKNNMMEMFFAESEFSEDELYEIYASLKRKKKYCLLKNNRIVDLDNSEAEEMYSLIEDLNLNPKKLLSISEGPVYQSFKAYNYKDIIQNDTFIDTMMNDIIHFKEADILLPKVNAKLRDYQKEGFRWLSLLSKYNLGGILADDMGLGKTLEMITLLKADDTPMPSLVVCPKSLLFNWVSEFHKFDSDAKVIKIYGTQQQRRMLINQIPEDKKIIYITGYDSLRSDIDEYQGKTFNYVFIDEAQAIKNVHTEKSKSVKMIDAKHRFALTGTPIENSVLDLWSIFDFIMPGYFPDLSTFKTRYEHDKNYVKGIAMKSAPFILRRTKDAVLKDLPPKFERIISADMTKEQRKVYDAHILDAKARMEAGVGAFEMLPYLTRLRQICVDPSLFIDNFNYDSGKMNLLKDILEEYIPLGHRILLFSSFTSALDIVEKYLNEKNIKYLKITGATKGEDRLDMVNTFNDDSSYKIFLISLKAGGTGLNLTGADTVIHLDPWWNVSAENQATDRAHRIGQKRNVEVMKLVCEDSIEQKVIDLQNLKKDIIDKVIAKNDSSITGLSLEDLKYILE